ncbi:hypothetical protein [Polyangium sp. 6x1]|uniref:hypothetical protein n=1 Tax=Polyangium sp. 6x1 TaxID=3042689 RepID=UPI002482A5EC|nr:hypothetical protein [Polyangium sp. 6x1]MDI1443061.1 hypothetical protein [Polyangium sp. 6x1]
MKGVDRLGTTLKVHWYCRPERSVERELIGNGLPVLGIGEDRVARVGRCLGHYEPPPGAAWRDDAPTVELRLDLGQEDGVQPGDRYEVLGSPVADGLNRIVTGFEHLGECIVQPYEIRIGFALCKLDRGAFVPTRVHAGPWSRGGLVHLVQPEPAPPAKP